MYNKDSAGGAAEGVGHVGVWNLLARLPESNAAALLSSDSAADCLRSATGARCGAKPNRCHGPYRLVDRRLVPSRRCHGVPLQVVSMVTTVIIRVLKRCGFRAASSLSLLILGPHHELLWEL